MQKTSNDLVAPPGKVLLREVPNEAVADKLGSLYIPDTAQGRQKYRNWMVFAVGDGCRHLTALDVGRRILVAPRWPVEFECDGQKYAVVYDHHIIGILEEV